MGRSFPTACLGDSVIVNWEFKHGVLLGRVDCLLERYDTVSLSANSNAPPDWSEFGFASDTSTALHTAEQSAAPAITALGPDLETLTAALERLTTLTHPEATP